MKSSHAVISFCYAFLTGIALMHGLRPEAHWAPVLYLLAVLTGLGAVAAWLYGRRKGHRSTAYTAFLLVVPALALGMARYMASYRQPDRRLLMLTADAVQASEWSALRFDAPTRLKLVVIEPPREPFRLRFVGGLQALAPVTDDAGTPRLSERGQWLMRRVPEQPLKQQSEWTEVSPSMKKGDYFTIKQPFSELTAPVVEGRMSGRYALYRVAPHMANFAAARGRAAPVGVLGRVVRDPKIFDYKTILTVTPHLLQFRTDGAWYPVEGGNISVTLKPDHALYSKLSRTEAYGYDVALHAPLETYRRSSFEGGFDPASFYTKHNIHGSMYLRDFEGDAPSVRVITPDGASEPRKGHAFIEFSLNLRDRMLKVIRETMPYPQSAFLGAVTLGLRYGLRNTRTLGTPTPFGGGVETKDSDDYIFEEFKEAGVNHVLAVSGLHVTIITIMFVGLFTLLRMPARAYAPFLILALVVFAVITGARPSTLRAVIMNSLFVLSMAYLDRGLKSSILLGVPVAAFIILFHNPQMITDPSFTLSFGAILSLALLTGPCYNLLAGLRGDALAVFLVYYGSVTALVVGAWRWMTQPAPLTALILAGVGLLVYFKRYKKRSLLPESFAYRRLPLGLDYLFAAQVAIQIGMMLPLSALYFNRWPIAGAYVNMIAIPLIGIVIQLGMLSSLLGLVPWIGGILALVLGAANWWFASFFVWLAHVAAEAFPYPFVSRPTAFALIVYYAACAVFIGWKPIRQMVMAWPVKYPRYGRTLQWAAAITGSVLLVAAGSTLRPKHVLPEPTEIHILPVGFGSASVVRSPSGKLFLFDGGYVQRERGRINPAERTLLPFLAANRWLSVDAAVLTSFTPERLSGLTTLLAHTRPDAVWMPEPAGHALTLKDYDAFRRELLPRVEQFGASENAWAREVYEYAHGSEDRAVRPLTSFLGPPVGSGDIDGRPLSTGSVVYEEEDASGRWFRIVCVRAMRGRSGSRTGPYAVLAVEYAGTRVLFLGDMQTADMEAFVKTAGADKLRADVLVMPRLEGGDREDNRRHIEAELELSLGPLLKAVKPAYAIFEFGNPRPVVGSTYRSVIQRMDIVSHYLKQRMGNRRVFNTDVDQWIFIGLSTQGARVQSWADRGHNGAGDESADDVERGL